MTDWEKLLSAAEVPNALRERKKTYLEKTTWRSALEDEQGDGWYFFKDTKDPKKVKVHKNKSVHDVFENRLWVLFASMGFYTLNRDQHFTINYSQKGQQLDKQIDVFAADDETVLVVECKCAESLNDKKQWKTELEAINGYMSAARSEIRKKFPEKTVFITICHISTFISLSGQEARRTFPLRRPGNTSFCFLFAAMLECLVCKAFQTRT